MAGSVCQLTVTGNLTRDAEMRTVGNSNVCEFTVAANDKLSSGEVAYFFRCALWGRRGEALCEYLRKGSKVCVCGHLSIREYTTNDGERRVSHDVRVDDVALMGGGGTTQGGEQPVSADAYDDVPF